MELNYLVKKKKCVPEPKFSLSIPPLKRALDIAVSFSILVLLSPLLILVVILLKLESSAPIIYKSKRVGLGYKIFDLYKFRSMVPGADKQINVIGESNLYAKEKVGHSSCKGCIEKGLSCEFARLFINEKVVCELEYLDKIHAKPVFNKFANDPRITLLGKFLRVSSIDELPQLFNILLGDMSLVGNRPLPLYEAEKLTTDQSIERFLAPAGLTGLWQVSKRGMADMSEIERIEMDIQYARTFTFWGDVNILLRTVPAVLQQTVS